MSTSALRVLSAAVFGGLLLGLAATSRADDLDIYTNPLSLPAQAPITVLALDLNVTDPNAVGCDNVLVSAESNCQIIRDKVTTGDLLALLGLSVPVVLLPSVDTLLSQLGPTELLLLNAVIASPALLALTTQQIYILGILDLLNAQSLIDARVAVILNHANKGAGGSPCAFADTAALAGERQDTVACSNGAYFFIGLANLADPVQLAAAVSKLVAGLSVPTLVGVPSLATLADTPFQTKEIYVELAKYLRGDRIYNGHLGYFDYGDSDATNNLNSSLPLLSWDTNIEKSGNRDYKPGLADYPQACTISLVNVQLTNAGGQDDSNAALNALYPLADANRDGTVTVPELAASAATDGFTYQTGDVRLINSYFVVQQALSDLTSLTATGANVVSYTDVLGLLGRGKDIASGLVRSLNADTSIGSIAVASSRSTDNGITTAAYLPVFRPSKDQKPAWPGNLKRLKFSLDSKNNVSGLVDSRGSAAIASDGRISTGALTLWTNASKLGSGVSNDGPIADLGGAGQNIPGFAFNGGGSPGRANPSSGSATRHLYYDSTPAGAPPLLAALNPDDTAVRAELIAATGATGYMSGVGACTNSCDLTASLCNTQCTATQSLCGTGCTTSQTTCSGTCGTNLAGCNVGCDTTQSSCNSVCGTTQTGCNASCATSLTGCNTGCGTTLTSCSATCTLNNTSCNTSASTTRTACNLAAVVATPLCIPPCLTGACTSACAIRSTMQNTCTTNYNSAVAACTTTKTSCDSTCSSNNSSCLSSCSSTNTSCGNSCTSNFNSCGSSCGSGLSSCQTGCSNTSNSCNSTCTDNSSSCQTACGTANSTCGMACSNSQSSCYSTCGVNNTRTSDAVNQELLLYARGYDVGTKAAPKGSGAASSPATAGVSGRPWLLGAVLHSRPVAINYGKRGGGGSDDVRIVFGSADGILHMLRDDTGVESWGFMPQAVMGTLQTLRENQNGSALPYGVDGAPVVLIRDRAPTGGKTGVIGDSSQDRVLLFFGLRRGGSNYYALDVTDPDAPPKLAWRIGGDGLRNASTNGVVSGSASQFSRLGLAFSTPQIGKLRVEISAGDVQNRSVLIFGGGYNGGRNTAGGKIGKDLNNSRNSVAANKIGKDDGSSSADRGNALFIIDAETGVLLWRAYRSTSGSAAYDAGSLTYSHPMLVDSIPSDVTALDTDNDGFTDRLYVGDSGGRLWRADLPGSLRSNWKLTPLASIGRHDLSSLATDRRIFFAPDYVPIRSRERDKGYDIVLFGAGDREDPLNLNTQNWVYAYRDADIVSGKPDSEIITSETDPKLAQHSDFVDQTSTCASAGTTSSSCRDVTDLDFGWRLQLGRTGEKLFSGILTVNGTTTFSSYVPSDPSAAGASICTPQEGSARLYSVGLRKSDPRPYLNQTTTTRDSALTKGGTPGDVVAVSRDTQAVGGALYKLKIKPSWRASWRERLGDDEKPISP